MTEKRSEILVGVDGSEPSLRAAEWAATDAAATGTSVTVCYVSDVSPLADVPLPPDVRQAARAYGIAWSTVPECGSARPHRWTSPVRS